jgi:thymidylate synthase (FAD)
MTNPIEPVDDAFKINVLDHGYVRLVDHMGSDLSIVRAARNSYDAPWRAGLDEGNDAKLLRYLLKNQHSTPFESVTMTFDVKLPIFVVRQWHRHRTWSYNEVSARYTELPEEFYFPTPGVVGAQHNSNKQMRLVKDAERIDALLAQGLTGKMSLEDNALWSLGKRRAEQVDYLKDQCRDAYLLYKSLIHDGWPRELARICLPLNIYTRMFATVNLHNLLHFIRLRDHDHAQHEIRVYAQAMRHLVSEHVAPETMQALYEQELAKAVLR